MAESARKAALLAELRSRIRRLEGLGGGGGGVLPFGVPGLDAATCTPPGWPPMG
jgi:protein ImuA